MQMFWGVMGGRAKLINKVPMVEAAEGRLPVYTLTFANPQGLDSLKVRIDHGDVVKVVVPSYKPKSYSMSAERPGEFDITLKVYPGGRASGFLDRLKLGDEIDVFAKGRKRRNPGHFVGLVAYGVGITEALPVAEAELQKPDAGKVVLLWAARTYDDLFWHDKVAALREAHEGKLDIVTILSREEREGSLHGRVDLSVMQEVFGPHLVEADRPANRFLSVGTKEMMRGADILFAKLGYPMPQHALLA